MSRIVYHYQLLCLALGFLTRIPVPQDPEFSQDKLNRCARYFPLVGLVVGALVAFCTWGCAQLLPTPIAVLLGIAASLRLTGAFHEDGLADSIDGLGGGHTPSRRLEIMKDSRLGTYGSCALLVALSLKWACLSLLFHHSPSQGCAIVIFAHCASRLAPLWLMASLPYAGDLDRSKSKPLAKQLRVGDFIFAQLTGLASTFFVGTHIAAPSVAIAVVVVLWWRRKLRRCLSGYTGDTLGAAQQLVELCTYLVAVARCVSF